MLHICLLKTTFKNKLPAVNGFHQLTPFPASGVWHNSHAAELWRAVQLEHCTTTRQIVRVINKGSSRWKLFPTCHFAKCKKHRSLQQ